MAAQLFVGCGQDRAQVIATDHEGGRVEHTEQQVGDRGGHGRCGQCAQPRLAQSGGPEVTGLSERRPCYVGQHGARGARIGRVQGGRPARRLRPGRARLSRGSRQRAADRPGAALRAACHGSGHARRASRTGRRRMPRRARNTPRRGACRAPPSPDSCSAYQGRRPTGEIGACRSRRRPVRFPLAFLAGEQLRAEQRLAGQPALDLPPLGAGQRKHADCYPVRLRSRALHLGGDLALGQRELPEPVPCAHSCVRAGDGRSSRGFRARR